MEKPWISLYQREVATLPAPHNKEYTFIEKELNQCNTFILPEYFSMHINLKTIDQCVQYSKLTLEWLEKLSCRDSGKNVLIIGGSVLLIDKKNNISNKNILRNVTPVFYNGQLITSYAKQNLFKNEKEQLQPGNSPGRTKHPYNNDFWGLMICADVLMPRAFDHHKQSTYIAIPTASPFLEDDTGSDRKKRDHDIYVKGAELTKSTILKCCCTGRVADPKSSIKSSVQGRSLIANGHNVLNIAPDIHWTGILSFDPESKNTRTVNYLKNEQ